MSCDISNKMLRFYVTVFFSISAIIHQSKCETECNYTNPITIFIEESEITVIEKQESSVLMSVLVNRSPSHVRVEVEHENLVKEAIAPNRTCCACNYFFPAEVSKKAKGPYIYTFTARELLLPYGQVSSEIKLDVIDQPLDPIGQGVIPIIILFFVILVMFVSVAIILCWKCRYDSDIEGAEFHNIEERRYRGKRESTKSNLEQEVYSIFDD
ncbi:uncharacterized protein LOC120333158 [Styela clava]